MDTETKKALSFICGILQIIGLVLAVFSPFQSGLVWVFIGLTGILAVSNSALTDKFFNPVGIASSAAGIGVFVMSVLSLIK